MDKKKLVKICINKLDDAKQFYQNQIENVGDHELTYGQVFDIMYYQVMGHNVDIKFKGKKKFKVKKLI